MPCRAVITGLHTHIKDNMLVALVVLAVIGVVAGLFVRHMDKTIDDYERDWDVDVL